MNFKNIIQNTWKGLASKKKDPTTIVAVDPNNGTMRNLASIPEIKEPNNYFLYSKDKRMIIRFKEENHPYYMLISNPYDDDPFNLHIEIRSTRYSIEDARKKYKKLIKKGWTKESQNQYDYGNDNT
jgi:hypothetical protein